MEIIGRDSPDNKSEVDVAGFVSSGRFEGKCQGQFSWLSDCHRFAKRVRRFDDEGETCWVERLWLDDYVTIIVTWLD